MLKEEYGIELIYFIIFVVGFLLKMKKELQELKIDEVFNKYMMSAETLGSNTTTNKPKWIRVKLPTGKNYRELRSLVDKYKLNTI